METNPPHSEPPWRWPDRGEVMSEEAYHEQERLNPDRKYEYISGLAYMMSGGSVGHDLISYNIRSLLDPQLRSGKCAVFGPDVQVLLGTRRNRRKHFVYPDATISCATADNLLIELPRVAFEVLSPRTEARDRGVKFKAYQQCPTMQEIMLVNQFAPCVEIWQSDEQDISRWHYRHYGPGETVAFAGIDVRVALADLYRGLDFTQVDLEEEE